MRLTYFDGKKAVGIGDLDRFMEYPVNQNTKTLNKDALYQAVAFVYRGVQLRAQVLSALPFEIVNEAGDVIDQSSDYQNAVGWMPDPVRMLSLMEQSLCVAGYSYWFREQNRVKLLDLKYWNPYTIDPKITQNGLEYFERNINGLPPKRFEIEDVFYVWPPDYRVEIGEPLGSPVIAAFKAAGVLNSTDEFVRLFFERGGVGGILIAAKNMTKEADRSKLVKWFKEKFRGGNSTAFEAAVVNADSMEIKKIGEGIDALDNPALTQERRESVAVALGIPMSVFLSSTIAGMGGGGVATQDDINLYHKTIEPEARLLSTIMNQQLFSISKHKIKFLFNTLDAYQVDETKRSLSWATYVQGNMKPDYAAVMLGLEMPTQRQVDDAMAGKDPFNEPEPVPEALADGEEESTIVDEALNAEQQKQRQELEKSVLLDQDLSKWRKKAHKRVLEGKPEKALEFDSVHIDDDTAEQIVAALKHAVTAGDVDAVFDGVGDVDLAALVELKRANDLLERTISEPV